MTTTITQFTASASGSAASAGIGGTASAGDWLVITVNADGGAASGGITPSDDVSGSTGWEQTSHYNDGTYYRQDWVKRCVGGETTVTATWGGSLTHGNMVGSWASNLTQPDLYVMGQGPTSNAFFSEFSLPGGCVRTDGETYIGALTCPGSVIIAEMINVCNTSGNGQNGSASCFQHYCNSEGGNSHTDNPGYHFAFGSGGGWACFYGFWTDPGQTFPVLSGGSGTAGSNTQDVTVPGWAKAGDLLTMVASNNNGSLDPTVTDDSTDGGAGWALESSANAPSGAVSVFTKVAVGGEQVVHLDWGTGINRAVTLCLWERPTFPSLYVIDEGIVSGGVFLSANPPSGNGQSYVAMSGYSDQDAATGSFGFDTPPGDAQPGGSWAFNAQYPNFAGHNLIFSYGDTSSDEGANTTADSLQLDGFTDGTYVVIFAIEDDAPEPCLVFNEFYSAQGFSSGSGDAALPGTAAAGDALICTVNCTGGSYTTTPTVIDDVSGSTGWSMDSTYQTGATDFRQTTWRKVAVGGETLVSASGGGCVGFSIGGLWIENVTSIEYLDAGQGLTFTDTVAPSADGMGYAALGSSVNEPSVAGLTTPTADGGAINYSLGSNRGGIATSWVLDSPAHTTADRPEWTSDVDAVNWVVMYAMACGGAPPEPVELEGVGTFGLGATGELDVEGGQDDLAGVGTFGLGGTGELTQTGGELFLAGDGTFGLGRTGLLTAPRPFPPVPPQPVMTGQLGCGIYDVFVFTRGLGQIVGRIPFNQITWSRVLDDTSAAEVTVNGVSNVGTMRDCCELLGSILPWEHEVGLYRNGLRVWSGPVTKVSFPSETVIIDALDLSAWLTVRNLHENHNDVQVDLATIWTEYVQDAMSVENSAGLYATVQALTGVLADRLYTQDMHTFASDAISELARTGLDWSCVDRRMVGGPVAVQPPAYPDAQPIPTLIDASFNPAPTIDRDGSVMANCVYSNAMGSGPGGNAIFGEYGPDFPATPDHVAQPAAPDYAAIEAQFGRIERVYQETKILDQPSADQNAATRYDLLKRPVDVISSGQLLPTAGIDIRQLTPGSLQSIHLSRACVQIGDTYRLKQLSVTANNDGSESVEGAWEPIGSIAAHEDLA